MQQSCICIVVCFAVDAVLCSKIFLFFIVFRCLISFIKIELLWIQTQTKSLPVWFYLEVSKSTEKSIMRMCQIRPYCILMPICEVHYLRLLYQPTSTTRILCTRSIWADMMNFFSVYEIKLELMPLCGSRLVFGHGRKGSWEGRKKAGRVQIRQNGLHTRFSIWNIAQFPCNLVHLT